MRQLALIPFLALLMACEAISPNSAEEYIESGYYTIQTLLDASEVLHEDNRINDEDYRELLLKLRTATRSLDLATNFLEAGSIEASLDYVDQAYGLFVEIQQVIGGHNDTP